MFHLLIFFLRKASVSIMVKRSENLLAPEALFLHVTSNSRKPHSIEMALPQNQHVISCSKRGQSFLLEAFHGY